MVNSYAQWLECLDIPDSNGMNAISLIFPVSFNTDILGVTTGVLTDHYETGNTNINIFDIQNNMFKINNDCAQSAFNTDASLIILGY